MNLWPSRAAIHQMMAVIGDHGDTIPVLFLAPDGQFYRVVETRYSGNYDRRGTPAIVIELDHTE